MLFVFLPKGQEFYLRLEKVSGTSDLWTNIGPNAIDMTSSFIPYWGKVSGRVRGLDVHPTHL